MRFFLSLRLLTLLALIAGKPPFAKAADDQKMAKIEDLVAPKPAPPPQRESQGDREGQQRLKERQLQQKRRQNKKRFKKPANTPDSVADDDEINKKQSLSLREEALKPRAHKWLLELALVGGGAIVTGERSGYTLDPNVHINMFWRTNPNDPVPHVTPWFGLRIAPFTGTGYSNATPGNYGLTYFGPIVGWGQLTPSTMSTEGESRPSVGSEDESELPTSSGIAVTMGIAGAIYQGQRSTEPAGPEPSDDFQTKKRIHFDPPGAWAELRYISIYYGGLSTDWLVGLQTGKQKIFVYAGLGFGGWY